LPSRNYLLTKLVALVPGEESVNFSGSTNGTGDWSYSDDGKAHIQVSDEGVYTVSGGTGDDVQGRL